MSFLRRKGWTDFSFAVGPAARTTRPRAAAPDAAHQSPCPSQGTYHRAAVEGGLKCWIQQPAQSRRYRAERAARRPAGVLGAGTPAAAHASPKCRHPPLFSVEKTKGNPGRLFNALGLPMPISFLLSQVSVSGTEGPSPGISASAASPGA